MKNYFKLIIITLSFVLILSSINLIIPRYFIEKIQNLTTLKSVEITKFDLFQPTFSIIADKGDGYIVIVDEFERSNFIFWKSKNNKLDQSNGLKSISAVVENKNLDEVKQITKNYDLSKVNPDTTNIITQGNQQIINPNDQKNQDAEKTENFYFDYINTKNTTQNKDKLTIDRFFGISNSFTRIDILNRGIHGDIGSPFPSEETATKLPETNFKIKNSKVNFIAVGFNKINEKSDDIEPEAKVAKIVLVMNDRSFVEVPIKPEGTFDWESVKSKWE